MTCHTGKKKHREHVNKVDASITGKIEEFASCLGGVIAGTFFSCKNNIYK